MFPCCQHLAQHVASTGRKPRCADDLVEQIQGKWEITEITHRNEVEQLEMDLDAKVSEVSSYFLEGGSLQCPPHKRMRKGGLIWFDHGKSCKCHQKIVVLYRYDIYVYIIYINRNRTN